MLSIATSSDFLHVNMSATKDMNTYLASKKGHQEIKDGCINLYGSNPDERPDTLAYVLCKDDEFDSSAIRKVGFKPDGDNHGISYIETGNDASVVIYSEEDLDGESYQIPQLSSIDLKHISLGGDSFLLRMYTYEP